ncbi:MAG: hypothetical protein OHK0057_30530 [Thermoflexibacter sp.]
MKSILTFLVLGLFGGLSACDSKQSAATNETDSNTPPSATVANVNNAPSTSSTTSDNPTAKAGVAKIEFDKVQHDFGTIKEGEVVKHKFTFKNVGDVPLVISDVKPTCGCTTTNFTKTPVMPNGQGEIELQFDSSGKAGPQHKPVTVLANVEGGQTQLVLTATVEAKPTIAGPYRNQ